MNKKTYFKTLFKQYRPFILLFFIICLVEPMLTLLAGSHSYSMQNVQQAPDPTQILANMLTQPTGYSVLVIILAFVAPFIVFSYLYDKPGLDNYLSMPISRKKLFFFQYAFTMIFMVVLPVLVGYICRNLVLIGQARATVPDISTPVGRLVYLGFMLIVSAFIFSIPSVLSIICTTTLFNGVIYAAVMHVLPAILAGFLTTIHGNRLDGVALPIVDAGRYYWLSYAVMHMDLFGGSNLFGVEGGRFKAQLPLLIWFLIAVGLFYLATRLFARRRVDRIRTEFMFRGFYPGMIASFGCVLMTFFLYVSIFQDGVYDKDLFGANLDAFIAIFVIGFVIFLVVELARYSGRPPLLKGLLSYALIFALALGLSYGAAGPWREQTSLQLPEAKHLSSIRLYNVIDNHSVYMDLLEGQNRVYDPDDRIYEHVPPSSLKTAVAAADSGKRDEQGRIILKTSAEADLPARHVDTPVPNNTHGSMTYHYQKVELKDPVQMQQFLDVQKAELALELENEKRLGRGEPDPYNQSRGVVDSDEASDYLPAGAAEKGYADMVDRGYVRTEDIDTDSWDNWTAVYCEYVNKQGKVVDQRLYTLDPKKVYQDPAEVEKKIEKLSTFFNGKLYYMDGRVYEKH